MFTCQRIAVVLALSWAPLLSAQSTASDRIVVADAISYLKTADVTLKSFAEFRVSKPADVIAFSPRGFKAPQTQVAPGVMAAGAAQADSVLTPGPDWRCREVLNDDMYLRARCALESSRHYVEVRGVLIDGDTAYVSLVLFGRGSQDAPRSQQLMQNPLALRVTVVREGSRWKGVHVLRAID